MHEEIIRKIEKKYGKEIVYTEQIPPVPGDSVRAVEYAFEDGERRVWRADHPDNF